MSRGRSRALTSQLEMQAVAGGACWQRGRLREGKDSGSGFFCCLNPTKWAESSRSRERAFDLKVDSDEGSLSLDSVSGSCRGDFGGGFAFLCSENVGSCLSYVVRMLLLWQKWKAYGSIASMRKPSLVGNFESCLRTTMLCCWLSCGISAKSKYLLGMFADMADQLRLVNTVGLACIHMQVHTSRANRVQQFCINSIQEFQWHESDRVFQWYLPTVSAETLHGISLFPCVIYQNDAW